MNVDLAEGDLLFWGDKYRTVFRVNTRSDGKLAVFFTDGLMINVNPDDIREG